MVMPCLVGRESMSKHVGVAEQMMGTLAGGVVKKGAHQAKPFS